MPLPPPPPGFVLDSQQLGPPVIRSNPQPAPQTAPQRQKDVLDVRRGGYQATGDALDNELKRFQIDEMRAKKEEAARKRQEAEALRGAATHQIVNVMDKAFEARHKSKDWFATGIGAGIVKNIGGTPAADVDGLLDTIGANTAFETLQKMRDASPTGGALGAISERELDLLKSTIASPKQGQSDKQFQKSMQDIVNAYGRILVRLPGGKEIAKQRGWIGGKKQQPQKPRVIDFNSLPE
jgi:hypothetical protein